MRRLQDRHKKESEMIAENLQQILKELPSEIKLVAVSKFHPAESIMEAYEAGQRVFGESRPQELEVKAKQLPKDIEWHFIGHLQTNKLKMVLPYATLVESVDSKHLLDAINEWGRRNDKMINVLLEAHIGAEESKQGFHEEEILELLFDAENYDKINFCGLMGMASHTDDESVIDADFERIDSMMAYFVETFPELASFRQLSIGMSGDWHIALRHGSTILRIGTAIFGRR